MNKSIWSEFQPQTHFKQLQEDIDCDVFVIGGGMAGILTAHFLEKTGRNVVIVEAEQIGGGITQNTTAVITAQHDATFGSLKKMHGFAKAKAYLDANLRAVEQFREMAQTIDCDFENMPSYRFSCEKDLSEEVDILREMGFDAELTRVTNLPFAVKSAVKFPNMAQFHPLKFLHALAKDLNIYEHTFIEKIKDRIAYTDKFKIRFKQAVVATHFPFINRTGWFFVKMYQKRSYVMALQNAGNVDGSFISDEEGGFYFRNYGGLLLVGKGDHRTGTETAAFEQLEQFKNRYYPEAEVKYLWANQDCVTLDDIPYVGRYGNLKDVYTLTGFNLWGMTGSMAGAAVLTDLLTGRQNEYAEVSNPKRRVLRAQLFKNLGVVLLNLVKPTVKRCPHLGCALKYNKREHTWDCACHGSRFSEEGNLIDNPAMKDAGCLKPKKDS